MDEINAVISFNENINPMAVQDLRDWRDPCMIRHYVRQLDVSNSDFAEGMYEE